MENAYPSPRQELSPSPIQSPPAKALENANDMELESLTSERTEQSRDVSFRPANKAVIDDVIRKTVSENFMDSSTVVSEVKEQIGKAPEKFSPVVPGFADFTMDGIGLDDKIKTDLSNERVGFAKGNHDLKTEGYLRREDTEDKMTAVNSEVNTEVTLKAGGLTDRLHDLGMDVFHVHHTKEKEESQKKGKHKGKVLIVCPECEGLNKEYMSWCTHCGEMIIGVEPMLVSKNREGKIRTKPLNKDILPEADDIVIKDPKAVDVKNSVHVTASNEMEVNYVQEEVTKPPLLDLGAMHSGDYVKGMDSKKGSPIKSDGKDSGRPSSEDHDPEIQARRIEEEVVQDICATISDPVVKGLVQSHFKQKAEKKDHRHNNNDGMKLRNEFESFLENGAPLKENSKPKNVPSPVSHDLITDPLKSETDIDALFSGNVQQKIAMFSRTDAKRNHSEDELEPPPLPHFSQTLPAQHNPLALKLSCLDYSTDTSLVVSHNYEGVETAPQPAGKHKSIILCYILA